jgi:hypothetical protein
LFDAVQQLAAAGSSSGNDVTKPIFHDCNATPMTPPHNGRLPEARETQMCTIIRSPVRQAIVTPQEHFARWDDIVLQLHSELHVGRLNTCSAKPE